MEQKKLEWIGIFSLAKILAVFCFLMGFIFGFLYYLFLISIASVYITGISIPSFGYIIIVFPIIGAISGFISGIVYAFLYNLIADLVGGLELRFK